MDLTDVSRLLKEASDLEAWAQETRRRAGQLLVEGGVRTPQDWREAAEALGTDARMVGLLVAQVVAETCRRASTPKPVQVVRHRGWAPD